MVRFKLCDGFQRSTEPIFIDLRLGLLGERLYGITNYQTGENSIR